VPNGRNASCPASFFEKKLHQGYRVDIGEIAAGHLPLAAKQQRVTTALTAETRQGSTYSQLSIQKMAAQNAR
jgi:hypothetical protein